jgi:CRP/FNR family transcriptional regulator
MSHARLDQLAIAIVLRLHEGPCTAEAMALDLGVPVERLDAGLDSLRACGIARVADAASAEEAVFDLIPDAYRAFRQPRSSASVDVRAEECDAPVRRRAGLLRACPLFAGAGADEIADLARAAQAHDYNPGEILFLQGEPCRGIYVVESGLIKIFKQISTQPDGGREQTVRLIAQGQTFNEVPAFDGGANPVSAQALEPSSVLLVPRDAVAQIVRASRGFGQTVILDLAQRIRHMLMLVEDLSMRPVSSRVAKILLQSIEPADGIGAGAQSCARLTQREIADMAGTAREVVARTLRDLERQEVISFRRGRIEILDPTELAARI